MKVINFHKGKKPATISVAAEMFSRLDYYMPPYLVTVDGHELLVKKYAEKFGYRPPANPPSNPGYIYSVNLAAAQIHEQQDMLATALDSSVPKEQKTEKQQEVWEEVIGKKRFMYMFAVYPGMTELTTVSFMPVLKVMEEKEDGLFLVRIGVDAKDFGKPFDLYDLDYCDVEMRFNTKEMNEMYSQIFAEMKERNQRVFDTMMTNASLIYPLDPLNIYNHYAVKYGNPFAPKNVSQDSTRTRIISYIGGIFSLQSRTFIDASCGRTGPHEGEYVLRVNIISQSDEDKENSRSYHIFYRVPTTLASLTATEFFLRRQFPDAAIRQIPMTKTSADSYDLITPQHIAAAMLSHYEAAWINGWTADFGENGTGKVYEIGTKKGHVVVLLLDTPRESKEVPDSLLVARVFKGRVSDIAKKIQVQEKIYELTNPRDKIYVPENNPGDVMKAGLIILKNKFDEEDVRSKADFPHLWVMEYHTSTLERVRRFVAESSSFSMNTSPEIVALMGLEVV